jgi:hypothetical protein|tara:strand:+ start:2031 stop:3002 length:972 start_codon:yes stop_codon:yes gene_type:complete
MAIQSGQSVDLTFNKEGSDTYATAATGNFSRIPYNSCSLSLAKSTQESNQLTGDRNVRDVFQGAHSVSGDISFNLSHQPVFIEMFKAILGDFTDTDFGDASSNGAGTLEVGNTRSSYTIHEAFTDLGDGNDNHVYTGCEFNSFSMTIPSDGLVECTVGVVGATMSSNASRQDGTVTDFTDTNDPYHSSDCAVSIDAGSSQLSTITELSLSIDNGISTTNRVGSDIPIQGGIGKCRVTGSMTAHFESTTLYEKFLGADETFDLHIRLGAAGQATSFLFDMPKVKITAGTVEVGGEGLVSVALEFTAIRNDSNNQTALTIDTDLS